MAAMAGAAASGECGGAERAEQVETTATRQEASMEQESDGSSGDDGIPSGGGTAAPGVRVRAMGRVDAVRELWCIREKEAFPSAENAASAMLELVEAGFGSSMLLHGPPLEVRVQVRNGDRMAAPLATGLVAIIRSEAEDAAGEAVEKLKQQAWQISHSLEECFVVKALGRNSNHAKELNWLATSVEGYLKEGLPLSLTAAQVKLGYQVLRSHVARDNGAEWTGAVFGINLPMAELSMVVQWAEAMFKAKTMVLQPELCADRNGGWVFSASIPKGMPGHGVKPAEYILGSAMVFLESPLDISDFEIGDSAELPGLEILMAALGKDKIVDVEASNRGLIDKGIIRVRIKCAIRFEKGLRSQIKKLVRQSSGSGNAMMFDTAEGEISVRFHSLHTIRSLEGEGGGSLLSPGKSALSPEDRAEARRKDAILEDLQAYQVKSAAALDLVIDQVQKLAVQQGQAQEHAREVHDALAAEHERAQARAREVHEALAAEQARALGTVNQLASVFTSFLAREQAAPVRLMAPENVSREQGSVAACPRFLREGGRPLLFEEVAELSTRVQEREPERRRRDELGDPGDVGRGPLVRRGEGCPQGAAQIGGPAAKASEKHLRVERVARVASVVCQDAVSAPRTYEFCDRQGRNACFQGTARMGVTGGRSTAGCCKSNHRLFFMFLLSLVSPSMAMWTSYQSWGTYLVSHATGGRPKGFRQAAEEVGGGGASRGGACCLGPRGRSFRFSISTRSVREVTWSATWSTWTEHAGREDAVGRGAGGNGEVEASTYWTSGASPPGACASRRESEGCDHRLVLQEGRGGWLRGLEVARMGHSSQVCWCLTSRECGSGSKLRRGSEGGGLVTLASSGEEVWCRRPPGYQEEISSASPMEHDTQRGWACSSGRSAKPCAGLRGTINQSYDAPLRPEGGWCDPLRSRAHSPTFDGRAAKGCVLFRAYSSEVVGLKPAGNPLREGVGQVSRQDGLASAGEALVCRRIGLAVAVPGAEGVRRHQITGGIEADCWNSGTSKGEGQRKGELGRHHREYVGCQSPDDSPDRANRSEGQSGGGGVNRAGLGDLNGGSSLGSPSHPQGFEGGVRVGGKGYCGTSGPRGRCALLVACGMRTYRLVRHGFAGDICLAPVRGRLHGGCLGSGVRGAFSVPLGGRVQRDGGKGVVGGVGFSGAASHFQCVRRGDGACARSSLQHAGCADDKLPLRAMVNGQHLADKRGEKASAARAGARGKPGATAIGWRGAPQGGADRMCGGARAKATSASVGATAGDGALPIGMDLVSANDLSQGSTWRLRSEAQGVDSWSSARLAGMCGLMLWLLWLLSRHTRWRWGKLDGCVKGMASGAVEELRGASEAASFRPGALSGLEECEEKGRVSLGALKTESWTDSDQGEVSTEGREGLARSCDESLDRFLRGARQDMALRGRLRLRGGGASAHAAARLSEEGPQHLENDDASSGSRSWSGVGLCWNARQLLAPLEGSRDEGTAGGQVAARRKLEFLEQQVDWHDPLFVALMEVGGGIDRMRTLRRWFRRRGFGDMVFMVGDGGSQGADREHGERQALSNGIALAVHRDVSVVSARRVAFRTFAATLLHKPSRKRLSVTILHGASTERAADVELEEDERGNASFLEQLEAAVGWCQEHEGAVLMDANRVPCRSWRSSAPARLSRGDAALRSKCGWKCSCCPVADQEEEAGGGSLIGDQLQDSGEPVWTRVGMAEGRVVRSRLDFGIAFGAAAHTWRSFKLVAPLLRGSRGPVRVSDHALVVYELRIVSSAPRGEDRPLPVNLGLKPRADLPHDGRSAWQTMADMTNCERFLADMRRAGLEAREAGRSQIQVLVELLRRTGEAAVHRSRDRSSHSQEDGRVRTRFDDRSEVKSWSARLKLAKTLAHSPRMLTRGEWATLFHARTGMRGWCPRWCRDDVESIPWQDVVLRCRRQLGRAERYVQQRQVTEDKWLAGKCQQITALGSESNMAAHVRTIWRMIRGRGESSKLNALHRGDRKEAPMLEIDDPEFLQEAGRIGEAFVDSMDKGTVPEAFRAWLEVFCCRQECLRGANNEEWSLETEFSFKLFGRVLKMMQGKAVGAGGLSVELLLAAGPEVQWEFYQALLEDVREGRICPSWRRVLYVLLRKPPPNDAAIVAQRREIALMPQDLKILLQGVRLAAYERISSRLEAIQFGWKKGMGCADPSLALACVLDQTRRLRGKVWILYVDLANFFPAINRAIACCSELFEGLPEEVADLLGQVYGGQRGEPSHVQCQYETGAGLGAPFDNRMGRLMGCPVSPDSAKILLNSVLMAIKASVSGVRLWPFAGEEICQLAFADDWVGVFEEEGQLRKALEIWLAWTEVVGARLGIKGLAKTVVSGADHSSGRARSPPDPGLQDLDGRRIPMLACDELYKHLGIPRAANAEGWKSWAGFKGVQGVRDKLRAGIARLRRLKAGSTSLEQFMCISNVLLGGLGGFYLQASVASFQELEQIEREWRRCFNRFAHRDPSSNALSLYKEAACWSRGRTHLAQTGMAALFAAVEKALSDVEGSPAQLAVRSAVALALHQWGCRSAPNQWQWSHLKDDLGKAISRKGARYIGDAWMLACILLEGSCCPEKSRFHRAEALRVRKWGRWRGLEDGSGGLGENPLRAAGAWWQSDSRMLFEPRERGGLGLRVRPLLIQAGVVELSHLCSHPVAGSGMEGSWQLDRKAAACRLGIPVTPALWRQWVDAIRVLKLRRIPPARPCKTAGLTWRRLPQRQSIRTDRARIGRAARWLRLRRLEGGGVVSSGVHAAILRETFQPKLGARPSAARRAGQQQVSNGCTAVGWSLDKDKSEHFEVGEDEAWQGDLPFTRKDDWAVAAAQWRDKILFREGDGWPLLRGSNVEPDQDAIREFPPALQLVIRARLLLGTEATTTQVGFGEKLRGVRVAEDVQRTNWSTLCELQSRMDFTHAFATDASEGELPMTKEEEFLDDWGWPRRRAAAAVVAHHGEVLGGCLPEDLPADSYLGELAAVIEALKRVPDGARVLLVIDSTSPVRAWLKFRRKGGRAQRQYKEANGLQLLNEQIRRLSLVYFLWQRSHCGSPMNEVADAAAEKLRLEGTVWLSVEGFSRELAGMWPSRVNGALFAWAISAGAAAVHEKLKGRESGIVLEREEGDWDVGLLQGAVGAAAALIREEKLMIADAGQTYGRREREEAVRHCPHGCLEKGGTWHHYLFRCQHPRLCDARNLWARWVYRRKQIIDPLGLHGQVTALQQLLPGPNSRKSYSLRDENGDRQAVRRLLCGFVERGPAGEHEVGEVKAAVKELIVQGLRVLCTAALLEGELRGRVEERIRDHRLLRKVLKGWLRVVLRGSPLRVAALRQLRMIRSAAIEICKTGTAKGSMAEGTQEHVLKIIKLRMRAAREEADKFFTDLGDEAIVWWFLQARGWQWWARRDEGIVKGMSWPALTPSAEAAIQWLSTWDQRTTRVCCRWVRKGIEGRRCPRPGRERRIRGGSAQCIDLEWLHAWACRAFFRLGGYPVLKRTLIGMGKERERLRWEKMRTSLANFRQFGSCSGRAPIRYREEEKIEVIIGKRSKQPKRDKEWEAGNMADARGRWAVESILEARRRIKQRGWELLVAWAGDHEPSWVRVGDLDRSLREEAKQAIEEAKGRLAAARALNQEEMADKKRQKKGTKAIGGEAPVGRKRSGRLALAEAKRRRLLTAIVVREAEPVKKRNCKRKSGMFGVKRVWGYHVLEGVEKVHVEWDNPTAGDEEVIPVAWLSEDLQAQVARSLAGGSGGGDNPALHPFFARWNSQSPSVRP